MERRWALRDATARSHHALDSAIGGFSTASTYEGYLRSNYGFRVAAERGMDSLDIDGWRPRLLAQALEQDMKDLGLPLPPVPRLPVLSESALIGGLYVLEGAALGGQILRRQAAALGFTSTHGARHLKGDSSNWVGFLAVLGRVEPYDAEQAAQGACGIFHAACTTFIREPT